MTAIMWIPVRLPQFADYHRMKGLDGNQKQQRPLRVSKLFQMSINRNTTGVSSSNLQQDICVWCGKFIVCWQETSVCLSTLLAETNQRTTRPTIVPLKSFWLPPSLRFQRISSQEISLHQSTQGHPEKATVSLMGTIQDMCQEQCMRDIRNPRQDCLIVNGIRMPLNLITIIRLDRSRHKPCMDNGHLFEHVLSCFFNFRFF